MSHRDSWFLELLQPLRASAQGVHPPRAVLHAYLKGQLPDRWRVRAHSLDRDDWTLTEVSQHALMCGDCAQQLAHMRRHELQAMPWRELWQRFPGAIRAHIAVYALALLALLALNALLVTVLPVPVVSRPCGSLIDDTPKSGQPIDAQGTGGNVKLDGVNRPVKLSSSLSGGCAPVPAPRPWWQTWWIGWVFLIWTMLLGLHILWDWLTSPTLQAPAPVTIRSIGFAPLWV